MDVEIITDWGEDEMLNGWLVGDSDMHIVEPADLWKRYIAPEWNHMAPVGMTESDRDLRVRVKDVTMSRLGRVSPRSGSYDWAWRPEQDSYYRYAANRGWDASSQIEAMNLEGIDSTVLFPSRGLVALSMPSSVHVGFHGLEPDLATAIAHAYNDWMADFVGECDAQGRVFGAAMLAPHDVSSAVDELARNVERGFKAAFLTPGLVDGCPWHDSHYDPLWVEAQRLDVPVCFHGGGLGCLAPDFSFSAYLDKLMLWHPFNQPLGIMFVVACFTSGGILERFPDLRVGLLEGNCSWAPFMMYRLDEHWEWTGKYEAPGIQMKPSAYLMRNCFLSCEADETPARHYFEEYGDDNVVYSTDYPHADAKFPDATQTFAALPLPEATKKKVLWDNYAKLYRLEAPGAVPT